MIYDERKANVFISTSFMFIQHFHPMYEYIWVLVAGITVTLAVKS